MCLKYARKERINHDQEKAPEVAINDWNQRATIRVRKAESLQSRVIRALRIISKIGQVVQGLPGCQGYYCIPQVILMDDDSA